MKKQKTKFKFKHNDVLGFPDTDSEYVDVGIGVGVKVAEHHFLNLVRVLKKGKGFTLQLAYEGSQSYSEAFERSRRKKNDGYISLKEYIDYFGNFDDLKFCCTWKDFNKEPEEKVY